MGRVIDSDYRSRARSVADHSTCGRIQESTAGRAAAYVVALGEWIRFQRRHHGRFGIYETRRSGRRADVHGISPNGGTGRKTGGGSNQVFEPGMARAGKTRHLGEQSA